MSVDDTAREFDVVIKHDFVSGVLHLRFVVHRRLVFSGFGS